MADILEVYTVNAFVADNQGGNTAGVVLNADGLKPAQMQRIAADLAFSETAFVLKSKKADFKVRFFTPTEEVNFCGHATVGAFATLFHTNRVESGHYRQETKAGLLGVEVGSDGRITMDQAIPKFGPELSAEEVAPLLGIQAEDILSTGLPVAVVSTGLADVIVPVNDESVLNALKPDLAAIKAFNKKTKSMAIHAFALTPTESDISARCRNFAPAVGIDEESATGSAAGALASYLHIYQGAKYRYLFEQGEILNRRSLLSAQVDSTEDTIERVTVGGLSDKPQRIPYRVTEEATQ
ncbi:PhzF family phenazine biosynthesis protein [Enterovibrio coralii]|uniref:Phenazine biosynthesis protein PhzF family n=1 Tax=Enterovibrio coralii TaxID=294935 RepID=A0A135ICM2_9GAMM|nr:PhzF family phenazine biosynthesis protein [Enterovibrio coralii]KXF83138.1 phenazine biosynthesis protein PhzF family [Enterovibrio coralii]